MKQPTSMYPDVCCVLCTSFQQNCHVTEPHLETAGGAATTQTTLFFALRDLCTDDLQLDRSVRSVFLVYNWSLFSVYIGPRLGGFVLFCFASAGPSSQPGAGSGRS